MHFRRMRGWSSLAVVVLAAGLLHCGSESSPGNDEHGTTPGAAAGDGTAPPDDTTRPEQGNEEPKPDAPATPALVTVPSVAVGYAHSCALRADGTVWCWGKNDVGQLGRGTLTVDPDPTPAKVIGLSGVARIVASNAPMCALMLDGTVRCWGGRPSGQFNATPYVVQGLTDVIEIAAGSGGHQCARKGDKTVWCWGSNAHGQLGHPSAGDAIVDGFPQTFTPTQVKGLKADGIALGRSHSCARTGSSVVCWGSNQYGELGHASGEQGDVKVGPIFANPTPVAAAAGGAAALFAGGQQSCILDASGTLSCWGSAAGGATPAPVAGLPKVHDVAVGASSCALAPGSVFCWGAGSYGQIGEGAPQGTPVAPVKLSAFASVTVVGVASGSEAYHHCALAANGSVYCWGDNEHGQLGHANTGDADCSGSKCDPEPSIVSGLP